MVGTRGGPAVIGATLGTVGEAARSALAWASAPPGFYVVAAVGGVVAIGVIAAIVFAFRRGKTADKTSSPTRAAAAQSAGGSSRILLLRLEGDADGAVSRRMASVLTSGLDGGAVIDGGAGVKAGRGLDDEIRRARTHAAKNRAGVVLWGSVGNGAAHLRIIGDGGDGPCEAYSVPAEIGPPFDAALVALVAAINGPGATLVRAAEAIAPMSPNDADNAARLRVVKARSALALHDRDRDRAQLDAALAATSPKDPREETEPLEWAEACALRGEAMRRAVIGLPEPPRRDIGERIDAWRSAMDVWTHTGAVDRVERSQVPLAEALLDLADAENDARGLEEAAALTQAALARHTGADATALTALLGSVHLRLGERDPRPTRLEAAERELRRALVLAEANNDRLRAAGIRDELARALAKLGERDRNAERLRAAAVIYRLILADAQLNELTHAKARAALGRALVSVGERERDVGAVDEAVAALRTAANSFTASGAHAAAAQARRALERAERLYGELRAAARAPVDAG